MLHNWCQMDRLIHGGRYPDQRKGYGFGNIAAMTHTEEEHKRNRKEGQDMAAKASALHKQREIKTFSTS